MQRYKSDNKVSLKQQLIRGASGSALVQVIGRLLGLAMGVVLARGLGVEGYGIYSYVLALMSLMMVFAELGMPTLVLRKVAAYQAHEDWANMRGLLTRSMQIVSLSSLFIIIIVGVFFTVVEKNFSSIQNETLIWAIALLPIVVITKVILTAIQSLQHVVKALTIEMLIKPLLVLLAVGGLFVFYPLLRMPQNVMIVQFIIAILVLAFTARVLYLYVPEKARTVSANHQTREWLSSALPLTLIGGASIINNQTDILMLGYFRTSEEVGIYRVATQGAALVAFGLQAANAVIAPQFSRLYAQGDYVRLQKLVTTSARIILLVALPVALTFILAGGMLAGLVFGSEFIRSETPIAILAAGQLVNAAMGSVGFLLTMTGHEKDVARTLWITAGLNILLNLVLIPQYGMAGAATATAVSLMLWNISLYKLVKKRIGINSTALSFNRV